MQLNNIIQGSPTLKNYKYFILKPQSSININSPFIQQICVESYHVPDVNLGAQNASSTQNRDSRETSKKQ